MNRLTEHLERCADEVSALSKRVICFEMRRGRAGLTDGANDRSVKMSGMSESVVCLCWKG